MWLPTPFKIIRILPSIALAIKSLINVRTRNRLVKWVRFISNPCSHVQITVFHALPQFISPIISQRDKIRNWVFLIYLIELPINRFSASAGLQYRFTLRNWRNCWVIHWLRSGRRGNVGIGSCEGAPVKRQRSLKSPFPEE
uniref:Uncharacterized protein MANES_06G000400 n=1 Tax=Rhizophora mucronata TaxID=61149 RepID=A0A2P2JK48_RHIMU